jgi:kumamolisin
MEVKLKKSGMAAGFRRNPFGAAVAGLFLGLGCTAAANAAAVPGGDRVVRSADGQETIKFALTLPHRNQAELQDLLRRLYTPGDARFHRFLGSAEFDERYAPSREQYEALKSLARQYGLSVVGEHGSRTVLDVAAPASTVRKVFGAQLQILQTAEGKQYHAPAGEVQLPFPISAIGADVVALNDRPAHTHLRVRREHVSQAEIRAAAQPHSGTQQSGSYAPADIQTAYDLAGIQNGGTPVAVFELSSANYGDAATYAGNFGLNSPNLVQKTVDGGTTNTTGSTEVMLDIEMIQAVSNPTTMYVYTGPNSGSGVLDTYTQIADDDLVSQVSTSWGECESSEGQSAADAENTVFTKMVAEGISLFAAAGDNGAYDCGGSGSLAVDDPASQPEVVGVGGTSLTTSSSQAYVSEAVWDTSSTEGGGGGISTFWSIPSYQQGVTFNGASGQYSTTMRNVPDVALDADPATGFYVYDSDSAGGWTVVGGTSDAAPQYAAFWSLVSAGLGKAAGFANPTLYPIAENAGSYASDFHDVTSGSNNYYQAVTGYDDASGWGSYDGGNLYTAVISALGGS